MGDALRQFSIGDVVWVPVASMQKKTRPCRCCNGDRHVTLILGTGEHVRLDCGACRHGYNPPTGTEVYHEFGSSAECVPITGWDRAETSEGEKLRYRSGTDTAWTNYAAERCFATRIEAMAACEPLIAEHEAEQVRKLASKEKNARESYAWNARYHLREAKKAHAQAKYHEAKAVILEAKASPFAIREPRTEAANPCD